MRIALNGTAYDHMNSGARERFTRLYGAVARLAPEHEFLLYSPREVELTPLFDGPAAGERRSPLSSGRPLRRFLRSPGWLARRMRRDGASVLVTDHFPVLGRSGAATVLTIHDLRYLVLPGAGSALRRAWFRRRFARTAARARLVVAVSETMRREVVERLDLPEERVCAVPNGVGPEFAPPGEEARAAFLSRYRLAPGYLLYVGVLEARKGVDLLVRARGPAPLVVAGRGGPEEARLRRLVARAGAGDRVRFLGYVPEEDLPALYGAAGALALPSRYEGFGLPVLQAMACGTPVAAARAAALPEVAGGAALLMPPDDETAWREGLARLLADGELRERLRTAGLARAREMTWDRAAERFLEALGRMATETGQSASSHLSGFRRPATWSR